MVSCELDQPRASLRRRLDVEGTGVAGAQVICGPEAVVPLATLAAVDGRNGPGVVLSGELQSVWSVDQSQQYKITTI